MNKKLQKGIVAAVAASLGTGIVAPVYAASAETTDLASKYAKAYEATVAAKTQKELTEARKLVDALYAEVKGTANEYLATTLSSLLDPLQQKELVKLDDAIKAAEASATQTNVNAARALIVDMPEVWRNAFSSYIDTIQNEIIANAVDAAKKAQESGVQADLDAANALYTELLTVTNNDGVKSWVETALKAELDKVVVKTVVKEINGAGAKKLTVSFNNPVVDTAKMVISVKRDNISVSVASVEWNADKTVATLTTTTSLQTGKYVATAKYDAQDATTTSATDISAAKVNKITFASPSAVMYDTATAGSDKKGVKVSLKVENQYGEDVTKNVALSDLNVTSSKGAAVTLNNGLLTIEDTADYTVDQKVVVTVVHKSTATVATSTLTAASAASVKSIEIGALTTDDSDLKGKDLFVSTDHTKYYLPITVQDQYGNTLTAAELNASSFTILSSNTKIVKPAATFTADSDGNVRLALVAQDATATYGTAVLTLVSASGISANATIKVNEDAKIDSLVISQPDAIVKQSKAVKLPFNALDQYGNELVSADDLALNAGSTTATKLVFADGSSVSVTNGTIAAKVDYANNDARILELTPSAGVDNVILTVITSSGKVQNLTLTVEDAVVPTSISGLKSTFSTALQVNVADTLADSEVLLKDQYGDSISLPAGYSLNIVSVDGTQDKVGFTTPAGVRTFTALAKGTEQFKVQLIKNAVGATPASVVDEYTFTTEAVQLQDITSYGINALNKQYTGDTTSADTDHNQTISVYGMKGTTKVKVNQSLIQAVSVTGGLVVTGTTLESSNNDTDGADKTAKLTVIVQGYDAPVTLTKDVTYNSATPKAVSVDLQNGSTYASITDAVVTVDIADLDGGDVTLGQSTEPIYFYVEDQYGVEIEDLTFTITNKVNYNTTDGTTPAPTIDATGAVSLTGVSAGDSFIINAISSNGITKTIKVFAQ